MRCLKAVKADPFLSRSLVTFPYSPQDRNNKNPNARSTSRISDHKKVYTRITSTSGYSNCFVSRAEAVLEICKVWREPRISHRH